MIFKGDKVIWMILLTLCTISVVEVFSATSTLTYGHNSHWDPIRGHSVRLLLGFFVAWVTHNLPYKWFRVLGGYPLFVCSLGMLLFVLLMGTPVNDARRYISLSGIQFQPSEFAKMSVVILTASFLSIGQTEEGASPKAFKQIMIVTLLACALIVPENYSTGVLLCCTVYLMMIIGRISAKKLLFLAVGVISAIALFVGLLLITPDSTLRKIPLAGHRATTVKARITDYMDSGEEVPASKFDIDDKAQVAHANIAIATSHIIGKGPGNSVERDFLSQAYSDFIFAIIIEEFGLVGGGVVVSLYIWLLVRAGRIARRCDRAFPAFLVLGIALLLAVQATFNMCVAVGLVPVTGQPLPLISRGGTSTIINCIYIGMILSVSRYTVKIEESRLKAQLEAAPDDSEVASRLADYDKEIQTAIEPDMASLDEDSEMR